MYEYLAEYVRNYDGDTITFLIDLGFGVLKKENIRLIGIDTPEIRGKDKEIAEEARDYVASVLKSANKIVLKTYKNKKGKYGRYLGTVIYDDVNLNNELLDKGFASVYGDKEV